MAVEAMGQGMTVIAMMMGIAMMMAGMATAMVAIVTTAAEMGDGLIRIDEYHFTNLCTR